MTAIDDLSHGKREAVPEGAELLVVDVRDPKLMTEMERLCPDAVVHLAAQMDVRKSVADPLWDASINVLGTLGALESARRAGVRRFVFASSGGAVYGEQDVFPAAESHPRRPASPYGTSKLCGEEYLEHYKRAHGLSTLCLRYANVYGPGQDPLGEAGVVAIFLHHLLGGRARRSTATACRPATSSTSMTWRERTRSASNRRLPARSTSAPRESLTSSSLPTSS